MPNIEYINFSQVNPKELMTLLNEDSLREHLIPHPYFNEMSIQTWMKEKVEIDFMQGCRVRVVSVDGAIAGWCGIQPDDNGFEIAIVISQRFWGCGIPIFKTMMGWAKQFEHKEMLFHLLDTRREYKVLAKMATKVDRHRLLGHNFTTYYFAVD